MRNEFREEISGLRAIAVIAVILFHANFSLFQGGFIGVDIFFVISGYLITNIILKELQNKSFSLSTFFERRIRRIIPGLYFVTALSMVAGYFLLMPDEYKNLGQSVVATTLFGNNFLLAITNNYWDLANDFKPLMHTWSLGVEEQYYLIAPIILILIWKWKREYISRSIGIIFISSLIFGNWLTKESPRLAFYLLPSRVWEIALGALVASLSLDKIEINPRSRISKLGSSLGLTAILFSFVSFNSKTPNPGLIFLLPTIGTVLVLIFAKNGNFIQKLLSTNVLVFVGSISYSLYLIHQPIFAFSRAFSHQPLNLLNYSILICFIFLTSTISWLLIEKPFRNSNFLSKKIIFSAALVAGITLSVLGFLLNSSYGMIERIYKSNVSASEIDKRIYNERVFAYKKDMFEDKSKKKLLIIGNSFARDFVNITTETFKSNSYEIVYRDDLFQCIKSTQNYLAVELFTQADVIVFASGNLEKECLFQDITFSKLMKKKIFYVGTKDFGYNLNWILRLDNESRPNRFNQISDKILQDEKNMANLIPGSMYISLLSPVLRGNEIPITDSEGRLLSADRKHLTRYGAIFFGKHVGSFTNYKDSIK